MENEEDLEITFHDRDAWEQDYEDDSTFPDFDSASLPHFEQKEKPSDTTFYIMLCIFFCYLFRISISGIAQLRKSIIPDILQSDSPVLYSMIYLDWCLWIVYGFWATILALKGSRSAIPSLKLCLPFHFVSFLLSRASSLTIFGMFASWLPYLIILFPLIFFIYLCSSKNIEALFPKRARHLGLPGLIGIALYIGLALVFIIGVATGFSFHKGVEPSSMQLHRSEYSDGKIIFTAEDSWILDSIATINSTDKVFVFKDTISNSIIRVSSYEEEYDPSRHYYIYSITECTPPELTGFITEIGYKGSESKDVVVFIDQYKAINDSLTYYWTYASIIDKKVQRSVRLSLLERDSLMTTLDMAEDFLRKSSFDVRSHLFKKNSIDQENNRKDTNYIHKPT